MDRVTLNACIAMLKEVREHVDRAIRALVPSGTPETAEHMIPMEFAEIARALRLLADIEERILASL